jgi:hypothetical protein
MIENLTLALFSRMVAAGTPLVYVTTDNEGRTESLITRTALQGIKGMPVPRVWTCAAGFPGEEGTVDPLAGLRWALEQEGPGIFVFKDMHWFWRESPHIQRTLKDFAAIRRPIGKTLVFIGAEPEIPPTLREDFLLLDHGLPHQDEIRAFLEKNRGKDPLMKKILADEGALDVLIQAAQGLDLNDIDRALRLARVTPGAALKEVVASLHRDKKQILKKSGIMEFVDNDVEPDQVGGMENLKSWMEKREKAYGRAGFKGARIFPHMDAGKAAAGFRRGHGQRHRDASGRDPSKGSLRRNLLCSPAGARRAGGDLPHPPA